MNILVKNKKAFFDYEVLKRFEAGLILMGEQVKLIRNGKASLKGAFVVVLNDEVFVTSMPNMSKIKLLLKHNEIAELAKVEKIGGQAIIPLSLYLKRGLIKMEIAICKGKKMFDKRHDLKRKSMNLDIKRALKHY